MAYSLTESIEKAWTELSQIENKILPQVNLVARKYAPSTVPEIQAVVAEYSWTLALTAEPGRLVEDVISSTVAEYIAWVLLNYMERERQKAVAEEAKQQAVRNQLGMGKKPRLVK